MKSLATTIMCAALLLGTVSQAQTAATGQQPQPQGATTAVPAATKTATTTKAPASTKTAAPTKATALAKSTEPAPTALCGLTQTMKNAGGIASVGNNPAAMANAGAAAAGSSMDAATTSAAGTNNASSNAMGNATNASTKGAAAAQGNTTAPAGSAAPTGNAASTGNVGATGTAPGTAAGNASGANNAAGTGKNGNGNMSNMTPAAPNSANNGAPMTNTGAPMNNGAAGNAAAGAKVPAASTGTANTAAGTQLSSTDKCFAEQAALSDQFEIQSSQLATKQAANSRVKAMAKQLIQDHTTASHQLSALAPKLGLQLPTTLPAPKAAEVAALRGSHGAAFDQAYVKAQVTAHQQAVNLFQAYSQMGTNTQLRTHATRTLPALKHHLQAALDLMKAMSK